jgi:hypothetical protein
MVMALFLLGSSALRWAGATRANKKPTAARWVLVGLFTVKSGQHRTARRSHERGKSKQVQVELDARHVP